MRGGVKKTLARRAPTAERPSTSARRRDPTSGRPIGTSTPTTAAFGKRSSRTGNRRSRKASTNRPFRSATAIQPPRAASTPSVSTATKLCPDQISVGEQKPERQQRQRRQAAEVAPDRERERGVERQHHQQPRPGGPQAEASGRRQEEREEHEVGQAQVCSRPFAWDRKRHREVRED